MIGCIGTVCTCTCLQRRNVSFHFPFNWNEWIWSYSYLVHAPSCHGLGHIRVSFIQIYHVQSFELSIGYSIYQWKNGTYQWRMKNHFERWIYYIKSIPALLISPRMTGGLLYDFLIHSTTYVIQGIIFKPKYFLKFIISQ